MGKGSRGRRVFLVAWNLEVSVGCGLQAKGRLKFGYVSGHPGIKAIQSCSTLCQRDRGIVQNNAGLASASPRIVKIGGGRWAAGVWLLQSPTRPCHSLFGRNVICHHHHLQALLIIPVSRATHARHGRPSRWRGRRNTPVQLDHDSYSC